MQAHGNFGGAGLLIFLNPTSRTQLRNALSMREEVMIG
jgi:hypothetical protein